MPAILLAGLLLFSCGVKKESRARYYPIDSLVTAQVDYLATSSASVQKITWLGETSDTVTVTPGTRENWLRELDIFRELNAMNKPINQGKYTLEEELSDSRSNLKIKAFTGSEELPVRYLKVYYQGNDPEKVRKIEAEYNQANSMYKAARKLTMEFIDIHNKPVLIFYSINGGQKVFLGDTVRYNVQGSVTLAN